VVVSFNSHDSVWGKSYGTVEEGLSKLTVYKFSYVLLKNASNVVLMMNSGKVKVWVNEQFTNSAMYC